MPIHVVQSGDSFHTIARDNGLTSGKTLYEHPDNAELKAKRPNPSILHPGDQVVVPEKNLRQDNVVTGAVHQFRVKLPKYVLRVRLLDIEGEPIASQPYTLSIGQYAVRGETGGDGAIAQPIPAGARAGTLTVGERVLTLDFGAIRPVDDVPDAGVSGARRRLRNLGYDVNDGDEGALDQGTRTTIALFQHDAKLDVTGELDDATVAKLVEIHGC